MIAQSDFETLLTKYRKDFAEQARDQAIGNLLCQIAAVPVGDSEYERELLAEAKTILDSSEFDPSRKSVHSYALGRAVMFSIACDRDGMVKLLIGKRKEFMPQGWEQATFSEEGSSWLCLAAFHHASRSVDVLLDEGANPNGIWQMHQPLIVVIRAGQHKKSPELTRKIASALLDKGADPMIIGSDDLTALKTAEKYSVDQELVERLQVATRTLYPHFWQRWKQVGVLPRLL